MPTEVKLPRLGQGMESGTIVRWLKSEGDTVKKSEPLYELDTDKVTQEVESDLDGVLLKIVVQEGEVEVGTTIAVIDGVGESAGRRGGAGGDGAAERRAAPTEPAPAPAAEAPAAAAALTATAPPRARSPMPAGGRIKASPLARRIARERGVDLTALAGTGPDGRIVAEDVESAPVGGGGRHLQ